ncbi:hypothetical protein MTO96_012684 [Rhipicephalus appendiculatus]
MILDQMNLPWIHECSSWHMSTETLEPERRVTNWHLWAVQRDNIGKSRSHRIMPTIIESWWSRGIGKGERPDPGSASVSSGARPAEEEEPGSVGERARCKHSPRPNLGQSAAALFHRRRLRPVSLSASHWSRARKGTVQRRKRAPVHLDRQRCASRTATVTQPRVRRCHRAPSPRLADRRVVHVSAYTPFLSS